MAPSLANLCSQWLRARQLPAVLFGFSFGAVLAFETARLLRCRLLQAAGRPVLGLYVASAEAPGWDGRYSTAYSALLVTGVCTRRGQCTQQMSDAAFEQLLREKRGTDIILQDEGMKKMFLPVIRAGHRALSTLSICCSTCICRRCRATSCSQ